MTAVDPWPAPQPKTPLAADVHVPGSKSLTARYLVLAALAETESTLHGALLARDTLLMIDALREIGCSIDVSPEEAKVRVTPPVSPADGGTIVCGLAGTVMRFIPPVVSLHSGTWHFDGDPQAYTRPLKPLLAGLEQLGVEISYTEQSLPFDLRGTDDIQSAVVRVDSSASSQFITALLLIGHRICGGLTVVNTADVLPSIAHIDMTIAAMADFGISATQIDERTWHVAEASVAGRNLVIEPDLSNASVFCAAAAVTGGTVRIKNWPTQTTQAGDHIRQVLTEMGAEVSRTADDLTVRGTGTLRGIDADLSHCGEITPTVAALAALADSPSRITGVAHLRGHETDRLAALEHELGKMGAKVHQLPDGLSIEPAPLQGTVFESYHDHRMATAGAILGLVVPGVRVVDIATTSKTIPDFVKMWENMLASDG